MNKGGVSKTIYAYPDILNGNEACIIGANYPDFMSLSSNIDKFLFTNIDDCCQAHGYICTLSTQEDTVTPSLKGEEVISLANSPPYTKPPHTSPLKKEEEYTSHIMHPPHTGPHEKSKSTPPPIMNSPDKDVSIVEEDDLDMLHDDLMSFSMSLYFNTNQPSPTPTADSTAVSSKQKSLEISASELIETGSADTLQFDPIKYMLLIVTLALAVVASMFYRRRRMKAIEEAKNMQNDIIIPKRDGTNNSQAAKGVANADIEEKALTLAIKAVADEEMGAGHFLAGHFIVDKPAELKVDQKKKMKSSGNSLTLSAQNANVDAADEELERNLMSDCMKTGVSSCILGSYAAY